RRQAGAQVLLGMADRAGRPRCPRQAPARARAGDRRGARLDAGGSRPRVSRAARGAHPAGSSIRACFARAWCRASAPPSWSGITRRAPRPIRAPAGAGSGTLDGAPRARLIGRGLRMAHRARRDRSPAGDPAASEAEHRPRFLSEDEIARLLEACHKSRNPWLGPLVTLALTSDARRGELETLTWEQLDLEADYGLSPNMRLVRTK